MIHVSSELDPSIDSAEMISSHETSWHSSSGGHLRFNRTGGCVRMTSPSVPRMPVVGPMNDTHFETTGRILVPNQGMYQLITETYVCDLVTGDAKQQLIKSEQEDIKKQEEEKKAKSNDGLNLSIADVVAPIVEADTNVSESSNTSSETVVTEAISENEANVASDAVDSSVESTASTDDSTTTTATTVSFAPSTTEVDNENEFQFWSGKYTIIQYLLSQQV
jgi:hypothetical protein